MNDQDNNPLFVTDLSYEEYRNRDVIETNDGAFFDGLDRMFGIEDRFEGEEEEAE